MDSLSERIPRFIGGVLHGAAAMPASLSQPWLALVALDASALWRALIGLAL